MTLHDPSSSPRLTLILGGVRSGKSAKAVALANADASTNPSGRVLFVASGQPSDDEMAARIAKHQAERPAHWGTLESPLHLGRDIAHALQDAPAPYTTLILDCVTIWVSNILLSANESDDIEALVSAQVRELLDTLASAPSPLHCIIVSNEVGLGVVPPTPLGRRYRDALGRANQLLAAAAGTVTLMVAGLELPLKDR